MMPKWLNILYSEDYDEANQKLQEILGNINADDVIIHPKSLITSDGLILLIKNDVVGFKSYFEQLNIPRNTNDIHLGTFNEYIIIFIRWRDIPLEYNHLHKFKPLTDGIKLEKED